MTSAREEILWRVRRATHDVPKSERPEDVSVERDYRYQDDAPHAEIVERFAERAAEYEATVHRVPDSELPGAIAEVLERRGITSSTTPSPFMVGLTTTSSPSVAMSLGTRDFFNRPRSVQRITPSSDLTQKNPLWDMITFPVNVAIGSL